jgi:predicted glycosyltransferase
LRYSGHRPTRVTLYSHDTYGLGHLRRNLAIAEHLLAREGRFAVRLLTGSPVAGEWTFPRDLEVTALPPVVKTGVETYAARDSELPFTLVKAYREALIVKAVVSEPPDILLVDHSPAGMNGELMASLAYIKRELPAAKVVIGLRDIIDSPEAVREIWRRQFVADLLKELYDLILVYGSQELFDVEAAYRMPPKVAAKVRYCGYVARPYVPAATHEPGDKPTVLVTAGGGEDGFLLMDSYLRCLRHLPPGIVRSLIVTGPLMADADRRTLAETAAGGTDIEFMTVTHDLPSLLQQIDVVVAMGGYNSTIEIVASGRPAILVPRTAPRVEQAMRAELFERLGLVRRALPGPDLDVRLAALINEVLAEDSPADRRHRLDMSGAARVAELFAEIAEAQAEATGA